MNKNAIKSFAVGARRRLREQVEQKAYALGISANGIENVDFQGSDAVVITGRLYDATIKWQRAKLVEKIQQKGFDQIMDEAAYTWFNRFIALRFMEVNNYLEIGYRMFSNREEGKHDPEILEKALQVDLPLDREKVLNFLEKNNSEELYKYLIITQCNVLNECLPFMFERISDYTELLFPDNLLNENSVMREMVKTIPEEDWREVEIIGWLYQYYISEKKDEVFAALKKNQKITKENIPAATQLFTPHWIVRYMVENSLGKLWLESHPNEELQRKWKYYLEPAEQEPDVQAELDKLINHDLRPEDITILDPACGSGHILVYAFDLLFDIYKEAGYLEKDIACLILEKNLYGLDIDDRAAQLACFAVMMKAREKSRRILREPVSLNICSIQESNYLGQEAWEIILHGVKDDSHARWQVDHLLSTFHDAKEYGSIVEVKDIDELFWHKYLELLARSQTSLFAVNYLDKVRELLPALVKQAGIMQRQYSAVVTNPPYMGRKGMSQKLIKFTNENYSNSKLNMFSVFIEKSFKMLKPKGFSALVTMQAWMFLPSFDTLRRQLLRTKTINSLVDMESMVMGIAFGTASTVWRNVYLPTYRGIYFGIPLKSINLSGEPTSFPITFANYKNISAETFKNIPGEPVAYWVSERVMNIFAKHVSLGKIAAPRLGMTTSDNDRFLRIWYEVLYERIGFDCSNNNDAIKSGKKWFPYNKGGDYRKWFGNNQYVINWDNDGEEVKNLASYLYKSYTRTLRNISLYFKECITWSFVSSSYFGVRFSPQGFLFDSGGSCVFPPEDLILYLTGFLCSKLATVFMKVLNPTLNFQVGNVASLPIIEPQDNTKGIIDRLVKHNINVSKNDWDSFETSWNFEIHPLIKRHQPFDTIQQAFEYWRNLCEKHFYELKTNEEELNSIFIEIYCLQDEMTPEIDEKDVTISKADLERDIQSYISYAVGCMMGRYSLDQTGLIYAGGDFDPDKYPTFPADRDAIIPILDNDYFEDDIVAYFVSFVKTTFGELTLSQNLDFIADALGRTGNESALDRIRKYFLNDFYKDHVRIYKKRPIYWLFTSGKQKAFNALIYMHRYDRGTVARIRTDYLHELQGKYELETRRLEEIQASDTSSQAKRDASKRLTALNKQKEELRKYDELLRHYADQQIEIDLDDGVKVNYAKFDGLLARID
ncbi:MAG: BREX-1 system adenine-specific DNA-methyltransferase PglX [Syntrophomonas sp.]